MSATLARLRVPTGALVVAWLIATAAPDSRTALAAGLALALTALVAVRAARVPAAPAYAPALVAIGRHDRARRATGVRLADPDAPGRTRPRAPGSLHAG